MENDVTVLTGKAVSVGYITQGRQRIVRSGLDFSLNRGELVCLLGANGAGKSTLLRTLAAIQKPLGGELMLAGRPLNSYTDRERSRLIGIVLTGQTQAGGLTVRELVSLGRQPYTGFFGRLTRTDEQIVDKALHDVGVADKQQRYMAELSDGERQKVMIAKALVQECPLVLLDEPTAFLDVVSRIEIMNLLHRLAADENRAILLSTHDVEQALLQADRLWLMPERGGLHDGVTEDLVLEGRMDELFPCCGIQFDRQYGIFSSKPCGGQRIRLSVRDSVLEHWTRNALQRNGWQVESGVSIDGDSPLLEVRSATELLLWVGGETEVFTSFGQLLERLKNPSERFKNPSPEKKNLSGRF